MWSYVRNVLAALLLSSVAPLLAATYYLSPTGNDWYFMNTQWTPWATIARLDQANLRSGDQVLFQRGGVWRETLTPPASGLYYGAYGSGARPVITGANKVSQVIFQPNGAYWTSAGTNIWVLFLPNIPSQVWFNGALGNQVLLTPTSSGFYTNYPSSLQPNQWFHDQAYLYVYSTVNPGFSNAPSIEAMQRDYTLNIAGIGNTTFEHLEFTDAYYLALLSAGNTGQQTFNDDVLTGAALEAFSVVSGSPQINSSEIVSNYIGLGVHSGSGFTLTNSIVSGSRAQAINVTGGSGPSSIINSTITGNSTASADTYTVVNTSAYPLSAKNSVLLPNPYQPRVYNYSGLTDAGNNVYQSPFFASRAAPLIVVPFVDDYINLGVAQAVTKVAQQNGCNISYAVNTKLLDATAWKAVAALQASGDEIVAHTRSHSDLANNNVFSIQYTGPAASATMTVNQTTGRLQTFLGGSATPDLNLDISDTYNGVIDVFNRIPAGSPYTVTIQPNQRFFTPINLANVANINIKTAPYTEQAGPNYLTWEIEGAQADLAANLPGYKVKAFATPFTSSNIGVENHIQNAGFVSNRNGLLNADNSPDGNWLLANLDVYNMGAEWLPFAYDATKQASSAGALVEGLGASGGVMAFYSHGYDEFTLQNWTDLFTNLKKLGATCMTMSQANAYIESKGYLVQDGTKKTWEQAVPLAPNYATTTLSPSQGATNLQ